MAAGCFSDYARAARAWEGQPAREPRDALETFVIAQVLAYNRDEKGLSLGRRLADRGICRGVGSSCRQFIEREQVTCRKRSMPRSEVSLICVAWLSRFATRQK